MKIFGLTIGLGHDLLYPADAFIKDCGSIEAAGEEAERIQGLLKSPFHSISIVRRKGRDWIRLSADEGTDEAAGRSFLESVGVRL